MKRNDFTRELVGLSGLLDLRKGDLALDAQTEADAMLASLYNRVTERGRVVGLCFGQETFQAVQALLESADPPLERVEVLARHPYRMPFKDELFHAAILRHDINLLKVEPAFQELWRVSRPGGRIAVRHTAWDVQLPKATGREEQMIAALQSPGVESGTEFFERFKHFKPRAWRDVRLDVFTVATRNPRLQTRHSYDWRRMLRDLLVSKREFSAREILNLIERLETARGAKVTVDRYLALAVKP